MSEAVSSILLVLLFLTFAASLCSFVFFCYMDVAFSLMSRIMRMRPTTFTCQDVTPFSWLGYYQASIPSPSSSHGPTI